MKKIYISVAGNIGSGKSTFSAKLSNHFGWKLFEEPQDNFFLEDFYTNMERWAFHSQIFYLVHFIKIHLQITAHAGPICQDRSIFESFEIFVKKMACDGILSPREYEVCDALYELFLPKVAMPTLLIYLNASPRTLLSHIRKRNRLGEQNITETYLENLSRLYDDWISSFSLCPVLSVDIDVLDIMEPEHIRKIFSDVERFIA